MSQPAAEAQMSQAPPAAPAAAPAADPQANEDQEDSFADETEASPDVGDRIAETEAPPIVPADADAGAAPIDVAAENSFEQADEPAEDVETVAARRHWLGSERRMRRWPLSPLHAGILALAIANVIVIGWRSDMVRLLPQTASFYALLGLPVNLRGLTLTDVVTGTEEREGVPILVVEGNVVNNGRKAVEVPRLKFVVRNAARQEIYSWTGLPSRPALQPGQAATFRARLASPPPDAHDLILRFVNRRDIVAGTE